MESDASVPGFYAAVDLGATSGRVVVARVGAGGISIHEVRRFENLPITIDGRLCWDVDDLMTETLAGLGEAVRVAAQSGAPLSGIGVDSWGVDYAFGDGPDWQVEHHRGSPSPQAAIERRDLQPEEIYSISGVLDQAINTGLRLATVEPAADPRLLFTPDLWVQALTGARATDPTIASTSQLLDVCTGQWSAALIAACGVDWVQLPELQEPGTLAGLTTTDITRRIGSATPVPVFRVAGHDTASAFAFARPARPGDKVDGLICSGTWSLVGSALAEPETSVAAMTAGFTNERGLRGTLMVRNLNGMWILQECLREWAETGVAHDVPTLVSQATAILGSSLTFDVSDERLLRQGDMVGRVQVMCAEVGRDVPHSPPEITRAIVESLASAYADGLRATEQTADVRIGRISMVGGGARNSLLCQLTADLTGLEVVAGPSEASSIGNLAVQIVATGARSDIASVYADLVGDGVTPISYHPRSTSAGATAHQEVT